MPARRRSASVTLSLTALLATSLTGCGEDEEVDNTAVCVDRETQVRVDDDRCDDDRGGGVGVSPFLWYYFATAGRPFVPGIGRPVSGGTFRAPPATQLTQRGGAPRDGATVSRGGFGSGERSGS